MAAAAHVLHRLPGRLRLRIPSHRGDGAWLSAAAGEVARLPGVRQVEIVAASGSLLIQHDPQIPPEGFLAGLDLWHFHPEPPPPPQALALLVTGFERMDQLLSQSSRGGVDLRTLTFLALASAALSQISRGQWLPPAISLLWHALDLVRSGASRGRSTDPAR